ncbi:MAG: cell division protein FtsH, partial [Bacillus sp. (in: Bacteria)]|nr:cell division protein FtsH [Bacillus sp. (in: firmicutes)]
RDKLNLIAKTLLEVETLNAEQIKYLVDHGEMPDPSTILEAVRLGPKKVEDVKVNILAKKDEGTSVEPLNPPDETDLK